MKMAIKDVEYNSLKCDKDCLKLCGMIFGFIASMLILAVVIFSCVIYQGKLTSIEMMIICKKFHIINSFMPSKELMRKFFL